MKSDAKTVEDYLAALPEDRREALERVRRVILRRLPKGYEESMSAGVISYQVPLSVYPDTYNGHPLMIAALASQKNHMAVYLMGAYGSVELAQALREGFARAGKQLDMGKSCIRFKRVDDLALDAIGESVAALSVEQYVTRVKAFHEGRGKQRGK